jgi:rhodanese-related sulfurtransferase
MDTDIAGIKLERLPSREQACQVPTLIEDDPGLVLIDATWGAIQPMNLAPGVETVGELELIEHLRTGHQLIDTRLRQFEGRGTIPGAVAISHTEIGDRLGELDPERPVALFCNGPQCAATPDAIRRLLAAGRPAKLIRYYRGGLHDWLSLGLPLR